MKENFTPKISIITCFFNVDQFIEETIKSLLKQKYKSWELLLIDDGSTDGSTGIAKKYADKYREKIFYHDHKGHINKGLSSSRNTGTNKSDGEYITFLDADDTWLPDYLLNQVNLLRQHECAMISEATKYWYSWNNSKEPDRIIPVGTKQDCLYYPPQLMVNLYPLGEGAAPCVCGIIIKKTALEKSGGFDESFTGLYEDQVFLSKIYLNEIVFISSACNNRYRQRPNSLVGASFENGSYFTIRKSYLEWLQNYTLQNKIDYPEVTGMLEKALQYQPLVSVIICFFNEEQFIEEAIKSVLTQTYTNWELILVDDGSADKSDDIALSYQAKYPEKIIYYEHADHLNKGLSASRNLGISKASGELIAFLDADDVWLPEKLITQVSVFQRNPGVGMAAEASIYWNDWKGPQHNNVVIPIGTEAELVYTPYELICELYPLGQGDAPVPSGLMIKKEAIERSGNFDESFIKEYSLYEDQAFLSKMYLQEKVYVSSACNNMYRQRQGSIVTWVREKGHYHNVRGYFLQWLQNFLTAKKIKDRRLNRLLKKALFPYQYPKAYYLLHNLPRKMWRQFKKRIPFTIRRFVKQKILRKTSIL